MDISVAFISTVIYLQKKVFSFIFEIFEKLGKFLILLKYEHIKK